MENEEYDLQAAVLLAECNFKARMVGMSRDIELLKTKRALLERQQNRKEEAAFAAGQLWSRQIKARQERLKRESETAKMRNEMVMKRVKDIRRSAAARVADTQRPTASNRQLDTAKEAYLAAVKVLYPKWRATVQANREVKAGLLEQALWDIEQRRQLADSAFQAEMHLREELAEKKAALMLASETERQEEVARREQRRIIEQKENVTAEVIRTATIEERKAVVENVYAQTQVLEAALERLRSPPLNSRPRTAPPQSPPSQDRSITQTGVSLQSNDDISALLGKYGSESVLTRYRPDQLGMSRHPLFARTNLAPQTSLGNSQQGMLFHPFMATSADISTGQTADVSSWGGPEGGTLAESARVVREVQHMPPVVTDVPAVSSALPIVNKTTVGMRSPPADLSVSGDEQGMPAGSASVPAVKETSTPTRVDSPALTASTLGSMPAVSVNTPAAVTTPAVAVIPTPPISQPQNSSFSTPRSETKSLTTPAGNLTPAVGSNGPPVTSPVPVGSSVVPDLTAVTPAASPVMPAGSILAQSAPAAEVVPYSGPPVTSAVPAGTAVVPLPAVTPGTPPVTTAGGAAQAVPAVTLSTPPVASAVTAVASIPTSVSSRGPAVTSGVPGVTAGVPGVTSGVPGVTSGVPGVMSGVPGAASGVPGVLPWQPPVTSSAPALQTRVPGVTPGVRGVQSEAPGVQSGLPAVASGVPAGMAVEASSAMSEEEAEGLESGYVTPTAEELERERAEWNKELERRKRILEKEMEEEEERKKEAVKAAEALAAAVRVVHQETPLELLAQLTPEERLHALEGLSSAVYEKRTDGAFYDGDKSLPEEVGAQLIVAAARGEGAPIGLSGEEACSAVCALIRSYPQGRLLPTDFVELKLKRKWEGPPEYRVLEDTLDSEAARFMGGLMRHLAQLGDCQVLSPQQAAQTFAPLLLPPGTIPMAVKRLEEFLQAHLKTLLKPSELPKSDGTLTKSTSKSTLGKSRLGKDPSGGKSLLGSFVRGMNPFGKKSVKSDEEEEEEGRPSKGPSRQGSLESAKSSGEIKGEVKKPKEETKVTVGEPKRVEVPKPAKDPPEESKHLKVPKSAKDPLEDSARLEVPKPLGKAPSEAQETLVRAFSSASSEKSFQSGPADASPLKATFSSRSLGKPPVGSSKAPARLSSLVGGGLSRTSSGASINKVTSFQASRMSSIVSRALGDDLDSDDDEPPSRRGLSDDDGLSVISLGETQGSQARGPARASRKTDDDFDF